MEEELTFGIPNDKEQLESLLKLIDKSWLATREKWQFLGQCIYNILEDEGYDVFERYTEAEFTKDLQKEWSKYTITRHGINTIRTLARRGDIHGFRDYLSSEVKNAALNALLPTSNTTELADIVKFMFGDEFVCTDVERQVWYQFRDNHWQQLNGGHILKQRFSRQLVPVFMEILSVLNERIFEAGGEAEMEKDDPVLSMKKNCIKIIKDLKHPSGKTILMKECSEIFYDDLFDTLLDENHNLLGTKNGIYDFNIMMLRPGFPEDYVSMQTGVEYDPNNNYNWDHEEVLENMEYFGGMLHYPDLIDFVLGHKSTCLTGGNKDKWLPLYIGETAHNGKTTYEKLDKYAFGKYFTKLPLGVMVGRTPNGGDADPAMANTQGKRLVAIDEANKNQKFNETFLKTRTGNDEFFARKLYSNGKVITPQFTIIMILNQAPRDLSSDAAIWERVILIPFDSRYVSNPPATPDEQRATRTYKADPFIDKKLQRMAPAYLWILIEYYKRYQKNGLKKPQAVIDKTKKYQKSSDTYAIFVDEKVDKSDSPLAYVQLDDLYVRFKQWYGDSYPNTKVPNKSDFEEEVKRLMGQPEGVSKKWHGYKMKTSVQKFSKNEA